MAESRRSRGHKNAQKKKKRYFKVFGQRVLAKEAIITGLVLVVIAIALVTVYQHFRKESQQGRTRPVVAISGADADNAQTLARTDSSQQLRNPDLPEARRLLVGHKAATGLERVQSLTCIGTYTIGNDSLEMQYYYRRPNRIRRMMAREDGMKRIDGFDGETAWTYREDADGNTAVSTINDPLQLKIFHRDARLGTYLWDYDEPGATLRRLDNTFVEGIECIVFEVDVEPDYTVRHYLDTNGLLERKRLIQDNSGDKLVNMETYYRQYKTINGVNLAHRIETFVNGQLLSSITWEKIAINRGVAGFLFDKPEA